MSIWVVPIAARADRAIEADADAKTTLNLAPLWQALEQLQQPKLAPIELLEVVAAGVTEIVLHFSEFAALTFGKSSLSVPKVQL